MKKISLIVSSIISTIIALGIGMVKFNVANIKQHKIIETLLTPSNQLPPNIGPKTMIIQYCDTCSTKSLYQQLQSYLSSRVTDPDFQFIPMKYNMSPLNKFLSYGITTCQVGLGLSAFLFPNIFSATGPDGQPAGGPRTHLFMLIFFGGNILRGLFTNSNAFEVYLGTELVYSALNNNSSGYATPPTIEQIGEILTKHGISIVETITE